MYRGSLVFLHIIVIVVFIYTTILPYAYPDDYLSPTSVFISRVERIDATLAMIGSYLLEIIKGYNKKVPEGIIDVGDLYRVIIRRGYRNVVEDLCKHGINIIFYGNRLSLVSSHYTLSFVDRNMEVVGYESGVLIPGTDMKIIVAKREEGIEFGGFRILEDYNEMCRIAAEVFVQEVKKLIREKGRAVVCFATGNTPKGMYRILREEYKDAVDWSRVITFNLDEYVFGPGVPTLVGYKGSFRNFMEEELFFPLRIPEENINFLNGAALDLKEECFRYRRKIKEIGGIDLCILGIGRNGHIAFNEPGSSFDSVTRVITLTQSTKEANKGEFGGKLENVPDEALTMGISDILGSKKIILLANGKHKGPAVQEMLIGPITETCPASVLQKHPQVMYCLTRDVFEGFGDMDELKLSEGEKMESFLRKVEGYSPYTFAKDFVWQKDVTPAEFVKFCYYLLEKFPEKEFLFFKFIYFILISTLEITNSHFLELFTRTILGEGGAVQEDWTRFLDKSYMEKSAFEILTLISQIEEQIPSNHSKVRRMVKVIKERCLKSWQNFVHKWVVPFDNLENLDRYLYSDKGVNSVFMKRHGLNVPDGFILSTNIWKYIQKTGRLPEWCWELIKENIRRLEEKEGKEFGATTGMPLIVSVRAGGEIVMPGKLDTILNVGLNDQTVGLLTQYTGNELFAYRSYLRFLRGYAISVLGMGKKDLVEVFGEKMLAIDSLELKGIKKYIEEIKRWMEKNKYTWELHQNVYVQLYNAIIGAYMSWNNERVRIYRRLNNIPEDSGLAVTVQVMKFGNLNEDSFTGVCFTRDPDKGHDEMLIECLKATQGEELVSGQIGKEILGKEFLVSNYPGVLASLNEAKKLLEKCFRMPAEIEFTVENGQIWFLQAKVARVSVQALLRIVYDMVWEHIITPEEGEEILKRSIKEDIYKVREDTEYKILDKGESTSPGARMGVLCTDIGEAYAFITGGYPVILCIGEGNPELYDILSDENVAGVIVKKAGRTSHEMVIARGANKPALILPGMEIGTDGVWFKGGFVSTGSVIVIDGDGGRVIDPKSEDILEEVREEPLRYFVQPDSIRKKVNKECKDFPYEKLIELRSKWINDLKVAEKAGKILNQGGRFTQSEIEILLDWIMEMYPEGIWEWVRIMKDVNLALIEKEGEASYRYRGEDLQGFLKRLLPELLLYMSYKINAVHELIKKKGAELGKSPREVERDIVISVKELNLVEGFEEQGFSVMKEGEDVFLYITTVGHNWHNWRDSQRRKYAELVYEYLRKEVSFPEGIALVERIGGDLKAHTRLEEIYYDLYIRFPLKIWGEVMDALRRFIKEYGNLNPDVMYRKIVEGLDVKGWVELKDLSSYPKVICLGWRGVLEDRIIDPEVQAQLGQLYRAGVKLFIVSQTPRDRIIEELKGAELLIFFEDILEAGKGKPSKRQVIEEISEKLKVSFQEVIVIDDDRYIVAELSKMGFSTVEMVESGRMVDISNPPCVLAENLVNMLGLLVRIVEGGKSYTGESEIGKDVHLFIQTAFQKGSIEDISKDEFVENARWVLLRDKVFSKREEMVRRKGGVPITDIRVMAIPDLPYAGHYGMGGEIWEHNRGSIYISLELYNSLKQRYEKKDIDALYEMADYIYHKYMELDLTYRIGIDRKIAHEILIHEEYSKENSFVSKRLFGLLREARERLIRYIEAYQKAESSSRRVEKKLNKKIGQALRNVKKGKVEKGYNLIAEILEELKMGPYRKLNLDFNNILKILTAYMTAYPDRAPPVRRLLWAVEKVSDTVSLGVKLARLEIPRFDGQVEVKEDTGHIIVRNRKGRIRWVFDRFGNCVESYVYKRGKVWVTLLNIRSERSIPYIDLWWEQIKEGGHMIDVIVKGKSAGFVFLVEEDDALYISSFEPLGSEKGQGFNLLKEQGIGESVFNWIVLFAQREGKRKVYFDTSTIPLIWIGEKYLAGFKINRTNVKLRDKFSLYEHKTVGRVVVVTSGFEEMGKLSLERRKENKFVVKHVSGSLALQPGEEVIINGKGDLYKEGGSCIGNIFYTEDPKLVEGKPFPIWVERGYYDMKGTEVRWEEYPLNPTTGNFNAERKLVPGRKLWEEYSFWALDIFSRKVCSLFIRMVEEFGRREEEKVHLPSEVIEKITGIVTERAEDRPILSILLWYLTSILDPQTEREGIVVYSLESLLESGLKEEELRKFIKLLRGKVKFYAGKWCELEKGSSNFLLKDMIIFKKDIPELSKNGLVVFVLDSEEMRELGFTEENVGQVVHNRFLLPIVGKARPKLEILFGLELLRVKGEKDKLEKCFKRFLVDYVRRYFERIGVLMSEKEIGVFLDIEVPGMDFRLMNELESAVQELERIIDTSV